MTGVRFELLFPLWLAFPPTAPRAWPRWSLPVLGAAAPGPVLSPPFHHGTASPQAGPSPPPLRLLLAPWLGELGPRPHSLPPRPSGCSLPTWVFETVTCVQGPSFALGFPSAGGSSFSPSLPCPLRPGGHLRPPYVQPPSGRSGPAPPLLGARGADPGSPPPQSVAAFCRS